jgi:16S rRNA (cytidine1402-2'-O)-methyltransferase
MYKLYIVGTPIGNLEDISPRALHILNIVRTIASENPARTRRLLDRYRIETPMLRFTDAYDRKKKPRLRAVLAALEAGDVALVSEAGMPLVADPGYELMQAVRERDVEVEVVPGPTALSAALSASGLQTTPFTFLGFMPRKSQARQSLLAPYASDERTLVLYESPNRLLGMLRDALAVLGERRVAVANELTKMYESVWRGTLEGAVTHWTENEKRGEYVVVIGGRQNDTTG